jgi:predicted AlkP superfamily phosphohydrolase/phosphomutase
MTRVLVIGLDALSPELVEQWQSDLPNIRTLMQTGIYGPLQSIIQPITPVAWPAMLSGRDPSHLGFTDFTYRVGRSYTDFRMVHARMITTPTLATLLPAAGKRMLLLSVPVSYPPPDIPGGVSLSCFMAPSANNTITSPPELQAELLAATSAPFIVDVSVIDQAAALDRDALLQRMREMDRQRFDIARRLMTSAAWDVLFMVAMGTDRVGHYFMRFLDPTHGRYDPDPRYADAIRAHYRFCDAQIGALLEHAGPDVAVLVVSDHGIQRMDGKVNLNDWLAAKGYLHLDGPVTAPAPLAKAPVDWSRTRAWSRGYGGQIYLNVRGRETDGLIPPDQVEHVLAELERDLQTIRTADGAPLPVRTIRGRDIYNGVHAQRCPDLLIQFDELRHLTSDLVGHPRLVTPITELGIDDASHANAGFLAMAGAGIPAQGRFAALNLIDVAPTVLKLLDVPAPIELEGQAIHSLDDVYSDDDEAELTSRLRSLYLE